MLDGDALYLVGGGDPFLTDRRAEDDPRVWRADLATLAERTAAALGDRGMALKSFEAAVASDADLTQLRSRIEVLRFRGLQDDVAAAQKAAY